MTEGRGKEFTDAEYRALGIDPEKARTAIPVSEWAKRLEHREPVELRGDVVDDLRAERDGRRGTRLWRLEKMSRPSFPKRVINRIRRPRGK